MLTVEKKYEWETFAAMPAETQIQVVLDIASQLVALHGNTYCDPRAEAEGGFCVYVLEHREIDDMTDEAGPRTLTPSCLIGHILVAVGADMNDLANRSAVDVTALALRMPYRTALRPDTVLVLTAMQAVQDYKGTWYMANKVGVKMRDALRVVNDHLKK